MNAFGKYMCGVGVLLSSVTYETVAQLLPYYLL
jgi:hypothetical protein